MNPPTMVTVDATEIAVYRASPPADGGSPITQYDFRWSLDEQTWTEILDIPAYASVTGLGAGVRYYGQNRAVNAIGPGDWSASAFADTAPGSGLTPEIVFSTWDDDTKVLDTGIEDEDVTGDIFWGGTSAGQSPTYLQIKNGTGPVLSHGSFPYTPGPTSREVTVDNTSVTEIHYFAEDPQGKQSDIEVETGVTVPPDQSRTITQIEMVETTGIATVFEHDVAFTVGNKMWVGIAWREETPGVEVASVEIVGGSEVSMKRGPTVWNGTVAVEIWTLDNILIGGDRTVRVTMAGAVNGFAMGFVETSGLLFDDVGNAVVQGGNSDGGGQRTYLSYPTRDGDAVVAVNVVNDGNGGGFNTLDVTGFDEPVLEASNARLAASMMIVSLTPDTGAGNYSMWVTYDGDSFKAAAGLALTLRDL
jgi:hypothetical protein